MAPVVGTATRLCNRCGESRGPDDWYSDRADGKRNHWCKPCYIQWHRDRYVPKNGANDSPRDCAWCGESYRPKQRTASIYCGRTCKGRARCAAERAARLATKSPRPCVYCGETIPATMRGDARFCTAACNAAAHLNGRRRFRPDRAGGLRSIQRLLERDGFMCGICGDPLDSAAVWPDPKSTSFDHIVPLSRQGSNDEANLRLTHLGCNCSRQARENAHHG